MGRNILLIALLLVGILGCKDKKEEPVLDSVELTVVPFRSMYNNEFYVELEASAKSSVIVDWGDGSKQDHGDLNLATHFYADSIPYFVKIQGETLKIFEISNQQLSNIRLNNTPSLKRLICVNNALSALNVSGCPKLRVIDCRGNELSSSALDALFQSLPTRNAGDHAKINIGGNAGVHDCNVSIANNKGWEIRY